MIEHDSFKNTRISNIVMIIVFLFMYFIFETSKLRIEHQIELNISLILFWVFIIYLISIFFNKRDINKIVNIYVALCFAAISIIFIYSMQKAYYCRVDDLIGHKIALKNCMNVIVVNLFIKNIFLSFSLMYTCLFLLSFKKENIKKTNRKAVLTRTIILVFTLFGLTGLLFLLHRFEVINKQNEFIEMIRR